MPLSAYPLLPFAFATLERAAQKQDVFGISARKVYPGWLLPTNPVGSYPTFSPLPSEASAKEDAAKAKAERLIGEEVLASLGGWKEVDFDALSLALAEIPGLVPGGNELDASADAAIARVDAYYARVHPKK